MCAQGNRCRRVSSPSKAVSRFSCLVADSRLLCDCRCCCVRVVSWSLLPRVQARAHAPGSAASSRVSSGSASYTPCRHERCILCVCVHQSHLLVRRPRNCSIPCRLSDVMRCTQVTLGSCPWRERPPTPLQTHSPRCRRSRGRERNGNSLERHRSRQKRHPASNTNLTRACPFHRCCGPCCNSHNGRSRCWRGTSHRTCRTVHPCRRPHRLRNPHHTSRGLCCMYVCGEHSCTLHRTIWGCELDENGH
jgi:hypothetical protein